MVKTARYRPSTKTQELRNSVYKDVDSMIQQRNRTYPQFNGENGNRTLVQFVNDSDRRLNANTPSREEQDKEPWQANVFNPVTREKLKAVVAGVARTFPEIKFKAINKDGLFDTKRAELVKQLERHSRETSNPQMEMFFEAWETAGKGTVIKYDGWLKTKYPRKFIKSFDLTTGKVEFDEKEVVVDDKPVDLNVPLQELFIWDFNIFDVQDQPKLAWIQHYNYEQLEQEFGQYPNFKFVKDKQGFNGRFKGDTTSYFYDRWASRVENEDDYEVVRYFNKLQDRYEIWVNGIDILIAPLLLGKTKKLYPFSKTIFEPFIDQNFFYGKSLPSVLEGNQDMNNTIWNTTLDKLMRSLTPPILVGLPNKDLLDVEEELVNQDNKLYVPDVNQVKPMPYDGVTSGDMAMLQAVSRMLDLASNDANQSGLTGRGVTASEIRVADENAQRLKGIFFTFLEDLWIQKTRLRIPNILTNYMQQKVEKVVGKSGKEEIKKALTLHNVKDVPFSDGTSGTLGVQVADNEGELFSRAQIQAREIAAKKQGENYKLIAVTSDYLDDWELDFNIIPESLFRLNQAKRREELAIRNQQMLQLFPEYIASNKEKMFQELLNIDGENIEDWSPPQQQEQAGPDGGPLAEGQQLIQPSNA